MTSGLDVARSGGRQRLDLEWQTAVGVHRAAVAAYAEAPPYSPEERYPEYPFAGDRVGGRNPAYASLRALFELLGYDRARAGTPGWNPLGFLIEPGMTVLLKPNMIRQAHMLRDTWVEVLTHGSVVRAVADYVLIALQGRGRIVVADGPQGDSRWNDIVQRMGLDQLTAFYRRWAPDVAFDLVDLRNHTWVVENDVWVKRLPLPGDPQGNVLADLGQYSAFHDAPSGRRLFGASYDYRETQRHHSGGRHEYSFSRSALLADVVINLPKLKTHKKAGVTISLKNLVGLNGNKNLLPHHSFGGPESGGDQFVRETWKTRLEVLLGLTVKPYLNKENPLALFLARRFKGLGYRTFGTNQSFVRSGNWYGNDTVWRMILDLNTILRFATPQGTLQSQPKRYLSVVDGIVAGQGNGPMEPEPYAVGIMAVGTNPVAVDFACARLMGFDYRKIRHLARAFGERDYVLAPFRPSDVHIVTNEVRWQGPVLGVPRFETLGFEPHFGWKGHIELDGQSTA